MNHPTFSIHSRHSGPESEHEAPLPSGHGCAIQPMQEAREIQEAFVFSLLLPLRTFGEEKILTIGLERQLFLQRLGF